MLARLVSTPFRRFLLGSTVFIGVAGCAVFGYYYNHYAALIQNQLEAGPFSDMTVLYAAPRPVTTGENHRASRNRYVPAPRRLFRGFQSQPRRLVSPAGRCHRNQSRAHCL